MKQRMHPMQPAWLALAGCAEQARLILDGLEH